MTPASALEITRRVSEYLRPDYDALMADIRQAPQVHIDETGEKVDGKKYWLWVFTTQAQTFFVIRKSRSKKVLEEVLGKEFRGYICCDGWRVYSNFTDKLQRCWSHPLREAECLAEMYEEAKFLYLGLKRLYWDLDACLVGDLPLWMRIGVKEEAEKRLGCLLDGRYESLEVKRFVQKMRNGFDHWFTFVVVAGLEATNNRAERALREAVVQRKIMGTFRNEKGTWIYETIMSLLATWKQQGLNRYEAMGKSLTAAWTKKS